MNRKLIAIVMTVALTAAAPVHAQLTGLELQGGVTAFSHGGSLPANSSGYASSTGWRGAMRLGIGPLSGGVEMQTVLDANNPAAAHQRYAGVFAAVHPVSLFGLTPYADAGVGRLFAEHEQLSANGGLAAWTYGLGAEMHAGRHWGVNASAHVLHSGKPSVNDVNFHQPPKTVSALLVYRF